MNLGLWRWLIPGLKVKRYVILITLGLITLVLAFVAWARVGPERNNLINWTARLIEFSESIGFGRWGLISLGFFGGLLLGRPPGGLLQALQVGLVQELLVPWKHKLLLRLELAFV